MATPTHTLIDSTTLVSNTASVTFSSIPADYRDLRIVVNATANALNAYLRMNSQTTNYRWKYFGADGAAARQGADTADTEFHLNAYADLSVGMTNIIIDIFDYTKTDKEKPIFATTSQAGSGVTFTSGEFDQSGFPAITEVEIFSGGLFDLGSTFYLYGIEG